MPSAPFAIVWQALDRHLQLLSSPVEMLCEAALMQGLSPLHPPHPCPCPTHMLESGAIVSPTVRRPQPTAHLMTSTICTRLVQSTSLPECMRPAAAEAHPHATGDLNLLC